jgi:hypothetical protein
MKWTKPFGLLLIVASVMVYAYVFNLRNVSAESPSLNGGNTEVLSSSLIRVDRLDASADRIIPADARLEKIADGFTWVEGPIGVKDGLFFADIPSDSIRKWTPGAGVSIFLKPSGYQGTAPYGGPEPGSNGMTLDHRGRLTVAGHAQRDVYRFESLNPKGPITILRTPIRERSSTVRMISSTGRTARCISRILLMAFAPSTTTTPRNS